MASTDSESIRPIIRPRRRRRWPWILLALTLAGGIWFGRFAYLRITLRPTPRTEYWEQLHAALDPAPPGALSPAGIAKTLAAFDDFETAPEITALTDFGPDNVLDGSWNYGRPDVKAVIAVMSTPEFEAAREAVRRGVAAGWQEQRSLAPHALWPSLVNYRQCAKWLVAHSRYTRVEKNSGESAAEDWLLVLRLARQCRRQQSAMAWLVSTSIESLVAHEMLLACREGLDPIDAPRFARHMYDAMGARASSEQLLAGTLLYSQCQLDMVYVREGGNWLDLSTFIETQYYDKSSYKGVSAPPSRIWNLTSPLFHGYETARRNVDNLFARYRGWDNLAAAARLENEVKRSEDRFRSSVLDGIWDSIALDHFLVIYYRDKAQLEGALASLGICEYQRNKGHFPDSLADLVPEFLPRVPVDLADDRPLRYRRISHDCVLYSIGSNGVDDGGQTREDLRFDDERNLDLVFSRIKREPLSQ